MFGFRKTLDVITLFHKASSPASVRIANVLKQASANATAGATEDQASDHSHQTSPSRAEFELEISENPPTEDQLKTIFEYVGQSKISSIINGAASEVDAFKKFKQNPASFKRPLVVDWENGKALASEKESEILKMINELNKK